ncbi:MAG: RagB/SusD family nutrient uptake outer membrane protein [Bacteroidales bacterium]|nr:RagB/SusD family nutrient uptake outer membrane protein [Bacteroidales bacterium]
MKTRRFLYLIPLLALSVTSCEKYLDKMPDSRTDVDTEDKVVALLTSAYPTTDHILVTELLSDNVDMVLADNPYTDRFVDQIYAWEDPTETDNEGNENIWLSYNWMVETANTALRAINELGGPHDEKLRQATAEALLCRAYANFMLVNLYCLHYNPKTADQDMGIPILLEPEEYLIPNYDRGTVKQVYEQIDADIQAALPMVGDNNYTAPKYHFNQQAAYAFATRFYLYYEQPEKAIYYADRCLGNNPAAMLRDCEASANMTRTYEAVTQHYVDASLNCNLLLATAYSVLGMYYGPYYLYTKYTNTEYLTYSETFYGVKGELFGGSGLYGGPMVYEASNINRWVIWKLPYLFEYTDAVLGIGYRRTVYPIFTADEVLLDRAEAYVLTEQYDKALSDIITWSDNVRNGRIGVLTTRMIQSYYSEELPYAYEDETGMESSAKKHLHPAFDIGPEGGLKESMIHHVLQCRRIETMQLGRRWFDIKRYGIEVVRRECNLAGVPVKWLDKLTVDDPRRALQFPDKAIKAGLTPNPRNAKTTTEP